MVSTEEGMLSIGAIQHNQNTWLNNISIFVLRITCSIGDFPVYHGQQFLNLVLNVTLVIEP